MKFYDKIIEDLKTGEHSLKRVYDLTFGFSDEVYIETSKGMTISKYTYGQCEQDVIRVSALLAELLTDVSIETPVGIMLPNCREWVIVFWALIRAGYAPLIIQPAADGLMLQHLADLSGMTYVINDGCCPLEKLHYIDTSRLLTLSPQKEHTPGWANRILIPTSGTTGTPKLFSYSGEAICFQILNSRYILDRNKNFRRFYKGCIKHLVILPFSHIFGLTAVFLWFGMFGRTFVLLPNLKPDTVLNTAQYHNVTHVFAVPLFWDTLTDGVYREAKKSGEINKLEKGVTLSLKLQNLLPEFGQWVASNILFREVRSRLLGNGVSIAITGGGCPRPETLRLMNAIGYPLHNGYGMTEIGITSVDVRHKPAQRMSLSIGKPLPSVEYQLRPDPENGGQVLWVRGKSCFTDMWTENGHFTNNPENWYCTNDFFRTDKDGNYYFVGRNTDILNGSNGELISLAMLDDRLHPAYVKSGCCIGRELANGQNEIDYVFEPVGVPTPKRLVAIYAEVEAVNSKLPYSMKISHIYMAKAAIPISFNGKIRRSVLSRGVFDGSFPVITVSGNEASEEPDGTTGVSEAILQQVICCFSQVLDKSTDEIDKNSHFLYDLTGNSMQYLQLLGVLEDTFGVDFGTEGCTLATPLEFALKIESM